jgi:hypothetical protein
MKKKKSWQEKLLDKEGHKVVRKGKSKNFTVADFEKSLINIIHIML